MSNALKLISWSSTARIKVLKLISWSSTAPDQSLCIQMLHIAIMTAGEPLGQSIKLFYAGKLLSAIIQAHKAECRGLKAK